MCTFTTPPSSSNVRYYSAHTGSMATSEILVQQPLHKELCDMLYHYSTHLATMPLLQQQALQWLQSVHHGTHLQTMVGPPAQALHKWLQSVRHNTHLQTMGEPPAASIT